MGDAQSLLSGHLFNEKCLQWAYQDTLTAGNYCQAYPGFMQIREITVKYYPITPVVLSFVLVWMWMKKDLGIWTATFIRTGKL